MLAFVPTEDAIFLEPVDETARPYVNIIAARKEDQDNEVYQKVVKLLSNGRNKESYRRNIERF